MLKLVVVLLCMLGGACTHHYVPAPYLLAHDRIPLVRASAPVTIVNAQTRMGRELLFESGVHTWQGDPHVITQHFAEQLAQALVEVGVPAAVASGPAPKRLDVAITSITARRAFFHFQGEVALSVTTGDGEKFELVAGNGSPGSVDRTLNGTLAIAVLETLKHPGVRAYLARPRRATPRAALSRR